MRKLLFFSPILVAPLLIFVGGCNSLHARMIAQDAVDQYHHGQISEAAAKFEQASKLDRNIPSIQLDLGFANLSIYQADPTTDSGKQAAAKAIQAFERYLELKPGEERAKSYLVQTFVDTGRYDDAVAFFQPAVTKTPPDGEALNTLGVIASKTGKFEDARKWYEKRIAAEPKNADAYLADGVLIWDHLHNHTEIVGPDRISLADEGLKILQKAIDIKPNAPNAYTYTNLLYRERAAAATTDDQKRPDLEKANEFFKKALELQKGGK